MSATVSCLESAAKPEGMGGNAVIWNLVELATSRSIGGRNLGVEKIPSTNRAKVKGITDWDSFGLDLVQMIMAQSDVEPEIEGYPVYFELEDDMAIVPAELPNSTYEDGSQARWIEWGHPNYVPLQINGTWYRLNLIPNAEANDGSHIPASVWVPWIASPPAGIVAVHSLSEVAALAAEV